MSNEIDMALPAGWTDDMNIKLPEGVSFEEVADLIISMKKQDSTHEMVESCLIETFALSPYDAALAWDRVCAGMVRASTGRRANCPDRSKDALAWVAFQRASQDRKIDVSPMRQDAVAGTSAPDYSQYSEQQLRQILNRLDRERFPERLAAIEARIAALKANDEKAEAQFEFPAGANLGKGMNLYQQLRSLLIRLRKSR